MYTQVRRYAEPREYTPSMSMLETSKEMTRPTQTSAHVHTNFEFGTITASVWLSYEGQRSVWNMSGWVGRDKMTRRRPDGSTGSPL